MSRGIWLEWWGTPVVPDTQEDEAGGSFESASLVPDWAT
jgi:hypothetical protein